MILIKEDSELKQAIFNMTSNANSLKSTIEVAETVIEPTHEWLSLRLGELWRYRELLYFITWRDVKVRYKQAVLGIAWAIIQPLMTMVIFSLIFGQLAKLPSEGLPYPVFIYCGLLPWQLFAGALQKGGTSLVGNAHLITKVYFPRLIIPLSAVAGGLVDFAISFVVLFGLMIYFGIAPSWSILWLPLFVLFTVLTALAVGLWVSALNVHYRDVQHIIPFMVQAWMFISPVAYSVELIPEGPWRILYGINPLTGVIQGFRWALLGGHPPDELMAVSMIVVGVLLLSGLFYFKRMEKTFADVV